MARQPGRHQYLRPLAAGLALSAFYVSVVSLPLEASVELGLSPSQTSTWILIAWGFPSLIMLVFVAIYRIPLAITGNVFILIFVLLLGGELSWSQLVGATMAAGAVVLLLGVTGLTDRLARLLPPPIVHGILAGAVLGLVADAFTALGTSTVLVGSTLIAYLISRALWGDRFPALLTALIVGTVLAIATSSTGPAPDPVWPMISLTLPQFDLRAIAAVTPVLVVLITLQANAPSVVLLRSQGYEPPERAISLVSGVGTIIGSFFGPMGVSLSLPSTALIAGPESGNREIRHWAGYIGAIAGIVVGLAGGFAADLIEFIPGALLDAIVGLAVLGILAQSLKEITKGPFLIGPLVAFVVSVSRIELLGLGRFFWALVFGLGVSLLLERSAWRSTDVSE
ncbi:MAG: benzoate/H(+) symporter BenE family transporter [Acidimicrobiia bacterium]|nr:benzoate/H(+) symporter BenE family transporter [Acidimicrobiia bacterium]